MKTLSMVALLWMLVPAAGHAETLFNPASYKSYVADHRAASIGQTVTLLIFEDSEAASDSESAGDRSVAAGMDFDSINKTSFANLDLDFREDDSRATQRRGRLRAQITAVVESVDEAGKLYVVGRQEILVNGEKQLIRIKGWLRPEDISPQNTAISTRLSDAYIEYAGDNLGGGDGIIQQVGDVILWVPKKALDLTSWLLGVL